MTINLISRTHATIFNPLQSWAEQSAGNWNMLIGAGFLLLMVSVVVAYVFYRKMGEEDERTNLVFLKSSFCMLLVIILCDMIFPKDDMWTIFFLFKYALAILAAGLYMAVQYRRDFA